MWALLNPDMAGNIIIRFKIIANYIFQKSTDSFLVQAFHIIITSLHSTYVVENFFAKQIAALFKAPQITQITLLQSMYDQE